jgi:protein-tyrosine phosphatase
LPLPTDRRRLLREWNVFGLLFLLLGLLIGAFAVPRGGWWLLAIWPAVALVVVAAGYLWIGAGVFGKTPTGTRRWPHRVVLWPYCLASDVGWRLVRIARRGEPAFHAVLPGVYIGRRAYGAELPPDVELIVDLTAEFLEPKCARAGRDYLCLPTLDASVPDDDCAVFGLAEAVNSHRGPVYIHCAEGHGRAALVTAFVLLSRGLAQDADAALAMVKAARPNIRPRPWQRARLRHWEQLLRSGGE